MTLTELRYIVALARERHFGRAAKACFVSQPTLSVAIRKLEEELGVALFERTNTDIAITAVGERVVAQAARVLEDVQAIQSIARHGADELVGTLRLGAIYTIAPYLFPGLIPALQAIAPHMPLLLEENFTAKLVERLRQGELDVILLALPLLDASLDTQVLYEEPFRVVLPKNHAWAQREVISADELTSDNMLLLGIGHCFRDQVLEACPALNHGLSLAGTQQTLQSGSLETIRYMVASGAGISVMPCSATQHQFIDGLIYKPFADPQPGRQVALAWRKSFTRMKVIQVLTQAVAMCERYCV